MEILCVCSPTSIETAIRKLSTNPTQKKHDALIIFRLVRTNLAFPYTRTRAYILYYTGCIFLHRLYVIDFEQLLFLLILPFIRRYICNNIPRYIRFSFIPLDRRNFSENVCIRYYDWKK